MIPTSNKHPTKTSASSNAELEDQRESDAPPSATNKDGVQGEGNYEAAREFNEAERKFVASGKVPAAARAAAPKSEAEGQELIAAEQQGKRRSKEADLALTNAWPDSATLRVPGKDAGRQRG